MSGVLECKNNRERIIKSKVTQLTILLDVSFRQCDLVHSFFMKLLRTLDILVNIEIVSGKGSVMQNSR